MEFSKPKAAPPTTRPVLPWNSGAFVGPKPPLKPKQVWSIRLNLQQKGRIRDLALCDFAIYSKFRGCDNKRRRGGTGVGRHALAYPRSLSDGRGHHLDRR